MTLQVLLSALSLENENYVDTLGITGNCVVVNQCDEENHRLITRKNTAGYAHKVDYIETKERGLSKSRNMAIRNAGADICIFCDNDVEYVEDYEELILNAFFKNPDADVIVFYIERKEKPVPNYKTVRSMGYLSVLKIFSPEIAFRRKAVLDIPFNEDFGAGAKYILGEENIFLYDCLKKGLKIYYMPIKIAKLREEESTWFKGYDEKFFISRGANYAAMSSCFSLVLIYQFAYRKKALYSDVMTTKQAIQYMLAGRKEYLSSIKK